MNDPCAPGYDPATGLYHISFQWNPNGPDWGDIAWGSATSHDMIRWTLHEQPCLSPETSYDAKGVFTGCFIKARDESITYAYTSVNHLPIHHTLQHCRGSESLSLAKSRDGGKTFERIAANPILPSEPDGVDVTGWRDPYVSKWPSMARFLGLCEDDTLFGIISGGIRDVTPTTFLYAIDANDLTQWRYLGPLTNFGQNLRPSRWSGDLGKNWEVTNFTTLTDEFDESIRLDCLIMGTEGCVPDSDPSASHPSPSTPNRPARGQLWMAGTLRRPLNRDSGIVDMSYDFGGHLDHGCLYAANSFYDPISQKRIVWGWITEEDLCDDYRHAQGWSGVLSMPRELCIQTIEHVAGASVSALDSITSIQTTPDDQGTFTIRTLGCQPFQPLVTALRDGPSIRQSTLSNVSLDSGTSGPLFTSQEVQSTQWELECVFQLSENTKEIGLSIPHSCDGSRATSLVFDRERELFIIRRPSFSVPDSAELINSKEEQAPHTLFRRRDSTGGKIREEDLHVRAWRDNSVLEVFVNGRTAISTRLYAAEETFGIAFHADSTDNLTCGRSKLTSATIWDNIGLV